MIESYKNPYMRQKWHELSGDEQDKVIELYDSNELPEHLADTLSIILKHDPTDGRNELLANLDEQP